MQGCCYGYFSLSMHLLSIVLINYHDATCIQNNNFKEIKMPYLKWISDADLENEVSKILNTASTAIQKATTLFNQNVIDPFSIMFEMTGFNIATVNAWETNEKSRKAQKTLSNTFGIFHQSILGHVNGWVDLGTGKSADLLCVKGKIIAEIKNKYNTVKGSSKVTVYEDLESLIMPIASKYHGYTAYYVETIPQPKRKKPQVYNVEFTPSNNKTKTLKAANLKIRKIDGKSFYALVTGDQNALSDLYKILPTVIQKLSGKAIGNTEITIMKNYFQKAFV